MCDLHILCIQEYKKKTNSLESIVIYLILKNCQINGSYYIYNTVMQSGNNNGLERSISTLFSVWKIVLQYLQQ